MRFLKSIDLEPRPPPGVVQTNPRFYKNPFKRPESAGGREGAVDLDKLFPEGTSSSVGRWSVAIPHSTTKTCL